MKIPDFKQRVGIKILGADIEEEGSEGKEWESEAMAEKRGRERREDGNHE